MGSLLAKTDIKSAYRLVPVHPEDRHYLGMEWGSYVYVDGMMPFGRRSAPIIFTAIADVLEWCIRQAGVDDVFDDYVVLGPPDTGIFQWFLDILERVCAHLGGSFGSREKRRPFQ